MMTPEERKTWLGSLKPGDPVIISWSVGYLCGDRLGKIFDIGQGFIEVEDSEGNRLLYEKTGYVEGMLSHAEIFPWTPEKEAELTGVARRDFPWTPEKEAEITEVSRRESLIKRLVEVEYSKLPTSVLEEIVKLVEGK